MPIFSRKAKFGGDMATVSAVRVSEMAAQNNTSKDFRAPTELSGYAKFTFL
jgi:hypothetical protein